MDVRQTAAGTASSVSAPALYNFDSWTPAQWDDIFLTTRAGAATDAGTRASFEVAPSYFPTQVGDSLSRAQIGGAGVSSLPAPATEWSSLLDFSRPSYMQQGVFFPYLNPIIDYTIFATGEALELISKSTPDKRGEPGPSSDF